MYSGKIAVPPGGGGIVKKKRKILRATLFSATLFCSLMYLIGFHIISVIIKNIDGVIREHFHTHVYETVAQRDCYYCDHKNKQTSTVNKLFLCTYSLAIIRSLTANQGPFVHGGLNLSQL
jgi:hypothetical protein